MLTQEGTSRTVQTRDWMIHYNEAGTGRPVILLHGSGAGATGWSNFAKNIEVLAERYHVYAVDMPGWGASEAVTWERLDHVESLRQFMDALGIAEAAIIGNSMGGITALGMATAHPERVSHLITMGSGSSRSPKLFSPGDGPTEGLKILFAGYRTPTPEIMRQLVEIMTFDPANATDEIAQQRSEAAMARPEHLTNILEGLPYGSPVPKWFSMDDLLSVQIPTLLIHGRDDRVVPYEHSLLLLAHIPNSRLVLLNRCGHWAQTEHADEFNRLVAEFIDNN